MEYTYLVYTMRFSLSVVVFHSFNTQLLIVCKFETLQCEESEYGVNVYFDTLRGWTGIVSVYLHLIGVRKKREEEERKRREEDGRRRGAFHSGIHPIHQISVSL